MARRKDRDEGSRRLRAARRNAGWTQEEMAEALSLGRSAYAHYEAGNRRAPDYVFERLEGLNVEPVEKSGNLVRVPSVLVTYLGLLSEGLKLVQGTSGAETIAIPAHMAEGIEVFTVTAADVAMAPLIEPGDDLVFEKSLIPKFGIVCFVVEPDGTPHIGVVQLRDGATVLVSLQAGAPSHPAASGFMGHLVGIIRRHGTRVLTDYDSAGIKP